MKQRPPSPESRAARRLLGRLCGAGALAALLLGSGQAAAQGDLTPVAPNILLLVDTSGSMDYKTSSNDFPTCRYSGSNDTGSPSERSRWIDLVEVLTGSIPDYQCQRLDRSSADFKTEFGLGGNDAYDYLYPNPYHRAVNNTCVVGPGTLDPGDPALFPAGAITYHPFNNLAGTCTFSQDQDGVLDILADQIRFGLMTFDTDPRPAQNVSGLWSYFMTGENKQGEPAGCIVPQDQEVGVRNPEAPPWEGRAVGFGNPAPGSVDFKTRNAMIQKVLLATRPYGATPIAGMLDDARDYLFRDDQPDPLDGSIDFGSKDDTSVIRTDPPPGPDAKTCRKQAVILLSDGQPNMDLRPFCEPGGCPYDEAEDIAANLKSRGTDVFVIGFALPKIVVGMVETTCASLSDGDLDTSDGAGICHDHPNDPPIQACCALNRIAAAGGPSGEGLTDWSRARFADDPIKLRRALELAIGHNMSSTSRSAPVAVAGPGFINSGTDPLFAVGYRFGASVTPHSLGKIWTGQVTRQRYKCELDTSGIKVPTLIPVNDLEGDDFSANVNEDGPDARTLITVVGNTPIESNSTIRPHLAGTVADGAGNYSGTQGSYNSTALVPALPPEAVALTDTSCDRPAPASINLTASECRDERLEWWLGLSTGDESRCPDGVCELIGDILHAAPRAVPGRPSELINDSSYDAFRELKKTRPAVLYAASNDGFLHAFKIAEVKASDTSETMKVRSKESNELWAFIPPGVLTGVPGLYQGVHQQLLDGQIAVKDVVATENSTLTSYKFELQRSLADAETGGGTWRTILVQSFGAYRPGYYAVDITDPVPTLTTGPKFLWQLTTDEDGDPLFGSGGGSPLITTVFLGGFEVAVAILPGGHAPPSDSGPCTRGTTVMTPFNVHLTGMMPRTEVPCYGDDPTDDPTQKTARSLTVVRLDTGEILRTFRKVAAEVPLLAAENLVTLAPLDSPLTGQPVAFPSGAGAVADRVFIGDQDGALWRVNLNSDSGDADDWTMDLFFDAFPRDGAFGHLWNQGQPIETPPIVSVDEIGNLTVAFSTGRQEVIGGAPKLVNYVWSLVEQPTADRLQLLPKVKWYKSFTSDLGERVVGTMALFNRVLYFTTAGVPEDDACDTGEGAFYAMHYLNPSAVGVGSGGVVQQGIIDALTTPATGQPFAPLAGFTSGPAALSGVAVAQQPTCRNTGTAEADEYFNYGGHNPLGQVEGGAFQVMIPIGSGTLKTGVSAEEMTMGRANAIAVTIDNPAVLTRVDSWGAIVE